MFLKFYFTVWSFDIFYVALTLTLDVDWNLPYYNNYVRLKINLL